MAQLNDTSVTNLSADSITVKDIEQPLITIGPKSEGFPTSPVENQIHIMWDDTTE